MLTTPISPNRTLAPQGTGIRPFILVELTSLPQDTDTPPVGLAECSVSTGPTPMAGGPTALLTSCLPSHPSPGCLLSCLQNNYLSIIGSITLLLCHNSFPASPPSKECL